MNQAFIANALNQVVPTVIASGLLVSLFTAQEPSTTLGPTGAQEGAYSDVDGLVDIRCMMAPESVGGISPSEAKSIPEIASKDIRHVLLEGFYPTLDAGWRNGWRAVIDDEVFDIVNVESDSQGKMTRLSCQVVTT